MEPIIVNATQDDFEEICHLFEAAILFIKEKNYIGWTSYDKAFIQSDIQQGLLYKLMAGGDMVGIFSICYSDALIWRAKEKGDAIYLHRIVLNRLFKGEKIIPKVLEWTVQLAQGLGLQYIRMDTWAANHKIIAYYKSYGFTFIENYTTPGTDNLPIQHRNLTVALLELGI